MGLTLRLVQGGGSNQGPHKILRTATVSPFPLIVVSTVLLKTLITPLDQVTMHRTSPKGKGLARLAACSGSVNSLLSVIWDVSKKLICSGNLLVTSKGLLYS